MSKFSPSDRAEAALAAIGENIGHILELRRRYDRDALFASWEATYAAIRCLEIISEAARRLTPEILDLYPDQPWRRIMDAGNVYRHGYDALDPDLVWLVLTRDIDSLAKALARR